MKKYVKSTIVIVVILLFLFCVRIIFSIRQISLVHSNNLDMGKDFYGEVFCLVGTEPKPFLFDVIDVNRVYGYNEHGLLIEYSNEEDYLVDYDSGTISRTINSKIPDYSRHKVVYNENHLFTFTAEPERNPELNVQYEVFVDYLGKYDDDHVCPQSSYLSESVMEKLNAGEKVKIALVGDSISAAAQTTSQYYYNDQISNSFIGYLREGLEEIYQSDIELQLISKGGMSSDYITDNLVDIVKNNPDLVIIEFGMNDHVNTDPGMREQFRKTISEAVKSLKSAEIDVCLIGFFQQNVEWERENTESTKTYNHILNEVAKEYDCYFADVYSAFSEVQVRKNIVEDMTADYMHHPNDFGHQVYASLLLPLFLTKDNIEKRRVLPHYIPIDLMGEK